MPHPRFEELMGKLEHYEHEGSSATFWYIRPSEPPLEIVLEWIIEFWRKGYSTAHCPEYLVVQELGDASSLWDPTPIALLSRATHHVPVFEALDAPNEPTVLERIDAIHDCSLAFQRQLDTLLAVYGLYSLAQKGRWDTRRKLRTLIDQHRLVIPLLVLKMVSDTRNYLEHKPSEPSPPTEDVRRVEELVMLFVQATEQYVGRIPVMTYLFLDPDLDWLSQQPVSIGKGRFKGIDNPLGCMLTSGAAYRRRWQAMMDFKDQCIRLKYHELPADKTEWETIYFADLGEQRVKQTLSVIYSNMDMEGVREAGEILADYNPGFSSSGWPEAEHFRQ
ncbi:MAG: hypothetical protein Q8O40_07055 [Chloroflexota bacterium]|nr:hypothetical protein [Chloroflexota bacterium]